MNMRIFKLVIFLTPLLSAAQVVDYGPSPLEEMAQLQLYSAYFAKCNEGAPNGLQPAGSKQVLVDKLERFQKNMRTDWTQRWTKIVNLKDASSQASKSGFGANIGRAGNVSSFAIAGAVAQAIALKQLDHWDNCRNDASGYREAIKENQKLVDLLITRIIMANELIEEIRADRSDIEKQLRSMTFPSACSPKILDEPLKEKSGFGNGGPNRLSKILDEMKLARTRWEKEIEAAGNRSKEMAESVKTCGSVK